MLTKLISDITKRNKQPINYKPKYISCIFMKNEIKKYRLITHASKKTKNTTSLNDIISEESKPVALWNLKTLFQWLYRHGNKLGLYITTFDLKDFFHHFRLHDQDADYCGYQILGKYLIALYSPYGVSSVPNIACTHSEMTTVEFNNRVPITSQGTQKYYVDDSTIIHHDAYQLHENSLEAITILKEAGFTESIEKRTWVKRRTKIYGWMFYTATTPIKIYLPIKKLHKIKQFLKIFIHKVDFCTLKFLFSLTGTLMHYSQINKIIKIICIKLVRKIYESINNNIEIKKQMNKIIYIPKWMKQHMSLFEHFLLKYQEFSINTILNAYKPQIQIATDATLISYGIYCYGYYISSLIPRKLIGQPVHITEAWTVIQALHIFKDICAGKTVLIHCDNEPTVKVLTRYWNKHEQWQPYLQERGLFMIDNKCIIDLKHVPGERNIFADNLSRGRLQTFYQECKQHKRPLISRLFPKTNLFKFK